MALIKCPECESSISEKALSCPYCGYPLQDKADNKNDDNSSVIKEKIDEIDKTIAKMQSQIEQIQKDHQQSIQQITKALYAEDQEDEVKLNSRLSVWAFSLIIVFSPLALLLAIIDLLVKDGRYRHTYAYLTVFVCVIMIAVYVIMMKSLEINGVEKYTFIIRFIFPWTIIPIFNF